jgi:hypothetical protein
MINRDSSGKEYAEIDASADERVRLTLVPAEEAGYRTTSLRVQIRQSDGKLRFGPEIPLAVLPEVLAAAWRLSVGAPSAKPDAAGERSDMEESVRLPRHEHREPSIDGDLYEKLCEVARSGGIIDYTSVFGDPTEARQAGKPLGDISMFDHIHGRPLVTVVAVRRDSGFPGAGFYNWARDHDAGIFGRCDTRVLLPGEDELAFVVRQRKAVDQWWQR